MLAANANADESKAYSSAKTGFLRWRKVVDNLGQPMVNRVYLQR